MSGCMHVGVKVTTMNKTQWEGGTLSFHSLNVRGLRDKNKQNKMFNFLKTNYNGILYLQEVHIVETDDKQGWYSACGEHVYFSYGNAHSKGTVTIIPQHIKCEIDEIKTDPNGRYVLIDGKFDEQDMSLLNYYGPTQDKVKEQLDYIDTLTPMIITRAHKLVWAGDLNVYLSPLLDRYNPITDNPSEVVNRIHMLLEEVNMCDIWRVLNPETKCYTWRKNPSNRCAQSRLDYWLTPTSYFYKVLKCNINPSILSDHNIITLIIKNEEQVKKGKGMWKLNVSLLNDSVYIKRINELIFGSYSKI
jgi:exonuclease III